MTRFLRAVLSTLPALALIVAIAPVANAADWQVSKAESSIALSGTHAARPFSGKFNDWTAEIDFDPEAPDQASVVVVVTTASAETGTALYDKTLPNTEWFDVANYPDATFATDSITALGDGQYEATGTLTIKGQETPVDLPFVLTIEGDRAAMQAEVTLDRIALGMGTKSDPDAAWVSQEIPVTITLVATR